MYLTKIFGVASIVITISNAAPQYLIENGQRPADSSYASYTSITSTRSPTRSVHSRTGSLASVVTNRPSLSEYFRLRQQIIDKQHADSFEHGIVLNDREQLANEVIMDLKRKEIANGFLSPTSFPPSQHIFQVMDKINSSALFKIIQKMPKGAVLHAHDTAMCKTDYIIQLTYRDHLWQCNSTNEGIKHFKFSRHQPERLNGCKWDLVADARKNMGQKAYDDYIRTLFTLFTKNPNEIYTDINVTWRKFDDIFSMLGPIVSYAPVWRDYYREALEEYYADGVQYLEFRGILPEVYDLDGKIYSPLEIMQTYVDVLDEYKKDNPDFIGSKFIYAPWRLVPNQTIEKYIENILILHKAFPTFMAGYDFVGQEDLGRRLVDFVPYLLQLPPEIKSFFHAGETNWFGETDENLVDAILLGAKRIGHGFALTKHPLLLQMVKDRGIVIELNPVSNQVLKLVEDFRNHPAAQFFAENVPLIVSSDDYSMWETTPLSHDFYQAFLGIASSHSDLRTLKKLAMNSIKYSTLTKKEKRIAFSKWKPKWDQFIEDVISDSRKTTSGPVLSNRKN